MSKRMCFILNGNMSLSCQTEACHVGAGYKFRIKAYHCRIQTCYVQTETCNSQPLYALFENDICFYLEIKCLRSYAIGFYLNSKCLFFNRHVFIRNDCWNYIFRSELQYSLGGHIRAEKTIVLRNDFNSPKRTRRPKPTRFSAFVAEPCC